MYKTFFFLTGLPRSGSTLLCNILAQNQRYHCTHTSGCLDLLFLIRNQWHQIVEHKAHPNDEALKEVLKSTLHAYYKHVNKDVIFEKSRNWMQYVSFIEGVLGHKAKMIVMNRSIPDILASIEKLHQKTSAVRQPPGEAEHFLQMQTLAGRCEVWMSMTSFLGLAYSRFVDAIRAYPDRLHIVNFDELTSHPKETVGKIYDFLGEKRFTHDFNHVEQVTHEDDSLYGFVGLHDIRNKVEPVISEGRKILGDELYFKYKSFDITI